MKVKYLFTILSASLLLCGCGDPTVPITEPTEPKEPTVEPGPELKPCPTYNEDSVQIHYFRDDKKYDNWALWLWELPSGSGVEYQFNGIDEFGAVASYPLSTWSNGIFANGLGFIVKSKGSWNAKDPDGDRKIDFSKIKKDEKGVYHVYLKTADKQVYLNPDLEVIDEITVAKFENYKRIIVQTNADVESYKVYENNNVIADTTLPSPSTGFRYTFPDDKRASFENSYRVEAKFVKSQKTVSASVSCRTLFSTSEFATSYTYDGELGAIYTKEKTTFKVWSPVSQEIKLRLYENGTPKSVSSTKGSDTIYNEYKMEKGEKGVFSCEVSGDLEGIYYTYIVTNSSYTQKECVDPYAYSTGVNGLRGMIVDFSKTNPEGFESMKPLAIDRKALTVYETHIADITSSSTWTSDPNARKLEKTFLGACLSGTTYTENNVTVKTGFDHIKELGANAVQLIPIFDQANDETHMTFNWGYNPSNYNALEGGYSSDPYDGYARIKEFKQLVKAYNEAGMNIIMDVVYNHMNGAVGSNFDILMPGYYFRYNTDGTLANGSGCGNETASDMPMFSKFMQDSICFWTKEYKLGGFRFDLMGLHDLDTMEQLTKKAKEINPNIVIYGEPWQGGTSPLTSSKTAAQANGQNYKGYGAFNDQMRDALIKGGLNTASATGWITNNKSEMGAGDLNKIATGVKGSTKTDSIEINDPNKTVNYVTCHDNYTLFDRIKAAGITDENIIRKMAMLANSVVFTSNGTTFMLAGEEMLRTKQGSSNSYESSYEVNELNYALKIKNIDMFKNYQKLLKLKQDVSGLHMGSGENNTIVADTSLKNIISYSFKDKMTNRTYFVVHKNGLDTGKNNEFDLSGYSLYLDTLNENKALSSKTTLDAYETIICYK